MTRRARSAKASEPTDDPDAILFKLLTAGYLSDYCAASLRSLFVVPNDVEPRVLGT